MSTVPFSEKATIANTPIIASKTYQFSSTMLLLESKYHPMCDVVHISHKALNREQIKEEFDVLSIIGNQCQMLCGNNEEKW